MDQNYVVIRLLTKYDVNTVLAKSGDLFEALEVGANWHVKYGEDSFYAEGE